jgi:hypothetical protein
MQVIRITPVAMGYGLFGFAIPLYGDDFEAELLVIGVGLVKHGFGVIGCQI